MVAVFVFLVCQRPEGKEKQKQGGRR